MDDDRQLGLFLLGVVAIVLVGIAGFLAYESLDIPGELWTALSGLTGGIIGIIRGVKKAP